MVNIEQVRLLEERVRKVIGRMSELRAENTDLRERLGLCQEKISELEERIDGFSSTQAEIEEGILNALHQLDEVEDAVTGETTENYVVAEPADEAEPEPKAEMESEVAVDTTTDQAAVDDVPTDAVDMPEENLSGDLVTDAVSSETRSTGDDADVVDTQPTDAAPTDDDEIDVDAADEAENGPELDIF